MSFDRDLQRELLQQMVDAYPVRLTRELYRDRNADAVTRNMFYLQAQGLVEFNMNGHLSSSPGFAYATVTARGADFIADDGGLSAILGVVTIKLHDDTIKDLVERRIMDSDLQPEEKKKYIDQLRELPAESTKHLAMKLIDMGLERGPAAIRAIGTLIAGLQI